MPVEGQPQPLPPPNRKKGFGMVEFPSYIRVVSGNSARRLPGSSSKVKGAKEAKNIEGDGCLPSVTHRNARSVEVVSLISRENHLAAISQVPTAEEASEAMRRLQEDLPGLGQGVDDIHSKLVRHKVIELLAPLVEN